MAKKNELASDTIWEHHLTGLEFEDQIFTLLSAFVKRQSGFNNIWHSKKVGDKGVDVIIEIKDKINLFNKEFNFIPKNESHYTYIFIEIKSRDKGSISVSEFANSLLKDELAKIQPSYLALITDTYVTPESHYRAHIDSFSKGYDFTLVDKLILLNFLRINKQHNIPMPPAIKSSETISVLHHIENNIFSPSETIYHNEQRLYVQIRNNTNMNQSVSIFFKTDRTTNLEGESRKDIHLNPFDIIVKPFLLTSKTKTIAKVDIVIDKNEIILSGDIKDFEFMPSLFGENHNSILKKIECDEKNDFVKVINITGEGGVGKSKIINSIKPQPNKILKLKPGQNTYDDFLSHLSDLNSARTIVIDDMHHGTEKFLNTLDKIIEKLSKNVNYGLKLILVGRNDYSFINTHYEKLCNKLNRNKYAHNHTINKWEQNECRLFITQIVKNAPTKLIDKIIEISNCNPFGVIQSIQYLLDQTLAELYDTDIVGITNIENIRSKIYIPESIQDLIKERIKTASATVNREDLLECLIALNFTSREFTQEEFYDILHCSPNSKKTNINVLSHMIKRQLIKQSSNKRTKYEFVHENISILLAKLIENDEYRVMVGKSLLAYYEDKSIEKYKNGYFYFLANSFDNAVHNFAELLDQIESRSKNLSSINISIDYLPYIRPLYKSILNTLHHFDRKQINNLVLTEVHLSTHLTHLGNTLKVIEESLDFITSNKIYIDNYKKLEMAIIGQKAHVILNLGHVSYAKSILEELVADIMVEIITPDKEINKILFDAYDRLQNIYHQFNYKKMFKYYSELSRRVAESLQDEQLISLVHSSSVKEYYFSDPEKHYMETKKATLFSVKNASDRHKIHAKLNEIIASLVLVSNKKDISNKQKNLVEIYNKAYVNQYTFSITRSLLAIATTYAMLGLDNEYNLQKCEEYTDKAIDSIIDYGNGFFKWQAHNLKAIIEYCKDKDNNKKIANGFFLNAISNLSKDGLLNLGNFDLLSINLSVLSNYFLFLQKVYKSEKIMLWFFRKIYYNGKCFNGEEQEFSSRVLIPLSKYKFIGANEPIKYILKEPSSSFYLAIR
jgi:hypothetical protein